MYTGEIELNTIFNLFETTTEFNTSLINRCKLSTLVESIIPFTIRYLHWTIKSAPLYLNNLIE